MDVFLSYADADHVFAKRLASDLTQRGISVWFDRNFIQPGSNILASVLDGISSSRIFMPLVSENSARSDWFSSEIAAALAAAEAVDDKRLIVPVLIKPNSQIPPLLQAFSAADLSDPNEYESSVTRLAESLKNGDQTSAFPPAAVLEKYNSVLPGSSEVILRMAEADRQHRHNIEREMLLKQRLADALLGTTLIAFVAVVVLAFSVDQVIDHVLYFVFGIISSNITLLAYIRSKSLFKQDND